MRFFAATQNGRRNSWPPSVNRALASGFGKRAIGLLTGASGFTLAEVLVAVGILTMASGLVGSSMFQVFSVERFWRDDVVATRQLRHANSWFAGDALNAETTNLNDGDLPVPSLNLTWKDMDGATHTAAYSVSGQHSLIRTFDGAAITLADNVVLAGFSLSGNILAFDLEVEAGQGETKTMRLQTALRSMAIPSGGCGPSGAC